MVDEDQYEFKLNISKKRSQPGEFKLRNFMVSIQGSVNPFNSVTIAPDDLRGEVEVNLKVW